MQGLQRNVRVPTKSTTYGERESYTGETRGGKEPAPAPYASVHTMLTEAQGHGTRAKKNRHRERLVFPRVHRQLIFVETLESLHAA